MRTTHKVKPTDYARQHCIADHECIIDDSFKELPAGRIMVLVKDADGFPAGPYSLGVDDITPLPGKTCPWSIPIK